MSAASKRAETEKGASAKGQKPSSQVAPRTEADTTTPLPDLKDFNRYWGDNVQALEQFQHEVFQLNFYNSPVWTEVDTKMFLDGLAIIEAHENDDIVKATGWGSQRKISTVPANSMTFQDYFPFGFTSYLAWLMRERGSSGVHRLSATAVTNKHHEIMCIWEAIQTLGNTTAGDPFVYDETCGYDHIRGDLGRDLDRLLTARSSGPKLWPRNLVYSAQRLKKYRHAPWPFYAKANATFSQRRSWRSSDCDRESSETRSPDAEHPAAVGSSGDQEQSNDSSEQEHSLVPRVRECDEMETSPESGPNKKRKTEASHELAPDDAHLETSTGGLGESLKWAQKYSELLKQHTDLLEQKLEQGNKQEEFEQIRLALDILESCEAFHTASLQDQVYLNDWVVKPGNAFKLSTRSRILRDHFINDLVQKRDVV